MLRGLIKTGVASTLHWSGADHLLARRPGVRDMPLIIGYHRVVQDFRAAAPHSIEPMLVSAQTFERQLDWIGQRYQFVTLDDLAAWTDGAKKFDRPVAAITFDDGYADVFHHAFPILKRKGIPAAVFVVTDLVGTSRLQAYDQLYLLLLGAFAHWRNPWRDLSGLLVGLNVSPAAMAKVGAAASHPLRTTWALIENLSQAQTARIIDALRTEVRIPPVAEAELHAVGWDMLREMSRAGVTVGSHSRSHARLTQESWEKVFDETRGSREEAESQLGIPVEHFAYPSGGFNAAVVRAVAAAGYRCAYTSCQHRDAVYPALTIPRRLWWENSCLDAFGRFSPALMSCQASGVFDFAESCHEGHAS
jgi:peptidoglycan/xylan/chitin deacetylase (PgdA/CDA1 family)